MKKGRSQGYLIRLVKLARGDIFETGKGSIWYSNVLNRIRDEHVVSIYYIRTLEVSQTHLKPLLYINYLVKLLNQFSCITLSPCSLRLSSHHFKFKLVNFELTHVYKIYPHFFVFLISLDVGLYTHTLIYNKFSNLWTYKLTHEVSKNLTLV